MRCGGAGGWGRRWGGSFYKFEGCGGGVGCAVLGGRPSLVERSCVGAVVGFLLVLLFFGGEECITAVCACVRVSPHLATAVQ